MRCSILTFLLEYGSLHIRLGEAEPFVIFMQFWFASRTFMFYFFLASF